MVYDVQLPVIENQIVPTLTVSMVRIAVGIPMSDEISTPAP
jgi:hypothetical protein